jgi:hypothetical protein
LNIKDLQRASKGNNDAVVRHYLEPGSTFIIPVYDKDPVSGWAKVLLDIFTKYNVSSQDYTLIHSADESLEYHRPALRDFYLLWKKVYRHNWWNTPNFEQLHQANRLEWYPLHHLKMTDIPAAEMTPASRRGINITFRGNSATNRKREGQVKEVEQVLGTKINGQVFESAAFSVDRSKNAYETEMLDSRLCLNIRGRTPECHRFYESLEFGCIPVFVDAYKDFDYSYQFQAWKSKISEVEWRRGHELPFIWVRNTSALKAVYERLLYSGAEGLQELDEMQRDSREWWSHAKKFMKSRFEEAVCSFQGGVGAEVEH